MQVGEPRPKRAPTTGRMDYYGYAGLGLGVGLGKGLLTNHKSISHA